MNPLPLGSLITDTTTLLTDGPLLEIRHSITAMAFDNSDWSAFDDSDEDDAREDGNVPFSSWQVRHPSSAASSSSTSSAFAASRSALGDPRRRLICRAVGCLTYIRLRDRPAAQRCQRCGRFYHAACAPAAAAAPARPATAAVNNSSASGTVSAALPAFICNKCPAHDAERLREFACLAHFVESRESLDDSDSDASQHSDDALRTETTARTERAALALVQSRSAASVHCEVNGMRASISLPAEKRRRRRRNASRPAVSHGTNADGSAATSASGPSDGESVHGADEPTRISSALEAALDSKSVAAKQQRRRPSKVPKV